jgi:hypothetical protein
MTQRDASVMRVLTMQHLKGAIDWPFVVVFAFLSCLLIALKQPSSFCLGQQAKEINAAMLGFKTTGTLSQLFLPRTLQLEAQGKGANPFADGGASDAGQRPQAKAASEERLGSWGEGCKQRVPWEQRGNIRA